MRRVVVLAETAEDLEEARRFYDAREAGVGDYCVTSLLADIESLTLYHGIHRQQFGCFRMLGSRFPFGMYLFGGGNGNARGGRARPAAESKLDSQTGDGTAVTLARGPDLPGRKRV
jgi:hypothetical protein